MTHAAHLLALLAVAAAIECPDETWLKLNGKCYSKRARGTHAECATICGANVPVLPCVYNSQMGGPRASTSRPPH